MNPELEILWQSFIPISLREKHAAEDRKSLDESQAPEYASLLWVDIAGFSTLSKRILANPELGLERLSQALHEHYDPLLNQVVRHGGEPVFFAGDGVLCAWYSSKEDLDSAILQAVAAAREIINSNNLTDIDGSKISLHTYIACGTFQLNEMLDDEGRRLVSPLGDALKDLAKTTKHKSPNNVLLSRKSNDRIGRMYPTRKLSDETFLFKEGPFEVPGDSNGVIPSLKVDLEALNSFLPNSVRTRLNVERLKWIDELRTVNALFLQLKNFKPGHSDAHESLQDVVNIISPIIVRNEGILGQLWIDEKAANALIYFGPPPSAHRDNPVRSINTALEISESLHRAGFKNSVGIASGQAFCGLIGNNAFRQYTVLGDIVNLSARLAENNESGVLCDTFTKNTSKDHFNFGNVLQLELKGGYTVEAWRPESAQIRVEDPGIRHAVGRDEELQMLFDTLERTSSGGPGTFLLEGSSGLGKTQLLMDFVESVNKDRYRIFTSRPEALQQGIPYQAYKVIFEEFLGIHEGMDKNMAEYKVMEMLGKELQGRANLLNVVLNIDLPESDQVAKLSGAQRAVATQAFLLELLEKEARRHELIIIVDDAQWMDEDSWRLTEQISTSLPGSFIICSLQNAEMAPLSNLLLEKGATKFRLNGLSDDDQDRLIANVLNADRVPPEIGEVIRHSAKGNPFFCIELTQALLDEKQIVVQDGKCMLAANTSLDDFELPHTIRGAIRRRIDLLDPGQEMALKVASVVGFSFPTDAVKSIHPIASERKHVPGYLEKVSRMSLIAPEVDFELVGYEFNHIITKEVAYESLLRQQREVLHTEAAVWMEETFASNLIPLYLKLADHWENAGNTSRAVDYMMKEAERLFGLGFARQATELGLRAVDMLGVKIETDPAAIGPAIGQKMGSVQGLLAGRDPYELIDHKKLEDPQREKALWLMLGVGPFAFQSQQIELFALIALTALEITLELGHGLPSADVYSMYSPVHKAMTGNDLQAYQWSHLAMELDGLYGGKLHSRVAFVHTWFHLHWKESLHKSPGIALKAAEVGFENQDVLFGCFNLSAHVIYRQVCGTPLEEVMATASEFLKRNGKRVMNAAFHLIHELQVAKALAGLLENPLVLTDREYEEGNDIAYILNTELGNQIGYYMVSKIKLGVHFGNLQEAVSWAENTEQVLPAFKGQVAEIEYVQFKTLALMLHQYEGGTASESVSGEIQKGMETISGWSENCPENFLHRLWLLQGLRSGLEGDVDQGISRLTEAAERAARHGYVNDEALAWEYATYLQKRNSLPMPALDRALESYARWGAHGKIAYLKEQYS